MKNKKQTKEEKKISEHFRELGKQSWEARKRAILDKKDIPKPNVK